MVHRMPTPPASRFFHLEIRIDAEDRLAWGAANGIAPEVLFDANLVSLRSQDTGWQHHRAHAVNRVLLDTHIVENSQ